METFVVLADEQIPFQDEDAVSAVENYVKDTKPDVVVELGDLWDFPYLTTKFLRKNTPPKQIFEDLAKGKTHLAKLRKYCDELILVEGNHENRLYRYILEKAEALEGLTDNDGPLNVPALLKYVSKEDLDFKYISPYGEAFIHKGFIFKHGERTSKYAASMELLDEGSSGISGHTHRAQMSSKTDRNGTHAWWSVGCLCITAGGGMPPGYYEGTTRVRNQQQGFAVVRFHRGMFSVQSVIIIDGHFISPEGRMYGPKGKLN